MLERNRHKSKTLSFHWLWSKAIHSWTVDWSWLSFDFVYLIKISLSLLKISLMIMHVLSTLIIGSHAVMEALVVVYWGFLLTGAVSIVLGVVAVFPVSSVCICLVLKSCWDVFGMSISNKHKLVGTWTHMPWDFRNVVPLVFGSSHSCGAGKIVINFPEMCCLPSFSSYFHASEGRLGA